MKGPARARGARAVPLALAALAAASAHEARADEGARGEIEGVRLLREPGEITNVIDGFERGDPIDVALSLGFAQSWAGGGIYREGLGEGGSTGRVGRFRQLVSRLLVRADVGVFRDVAAYVRSPVVLRDVREVSADGAGFLLGNGEGGAPEQLGPLPFKSPERSGLEYVAIGLEAGPFNQARQPAMPSWLVGAELRLNVAEPLHACGREAGNNLTGAQVACAHPSDVNRDGTSGGPLEGASFGRTRKPGVGRGTTGVEVHTVLSRRQGYLEPYIGARGLVEFARGSSDFAYADSPAVPTRAPPWEAGAFAGLLIIPLEVREQFQRLTFDLRLGASYRSAGRDVSPLFDLLGASDASSLRRPALDAAGGVAAPGAYVTGLSEQGAYATFAFSGGAQYQVGEYMKFQTGLGYKRASSYLVTGERPCSSGGVAAASGPCYEAGLGSNPLYREAVDAPGRRFLIGEAWQVDLWLQAVVMFLRFSVPCSLPMPARLAPPRRLGRRLASAGWAPLAASLVVLARSAGGQPQPGAPAAAGSAAAPSPSGTAASGASHAGAAASGGARSGVAPGGATPSGAHSGATTPGGAHSGAATPGGAHSGAAAPGGAHSGSLPTGAPPTGAPGAARRPAEPAVGQAPAGEPLAGPSAPAGQAPALLWPTLTPAGDEPAGEPLRIPSEKDGPLAERARDLDALLVDTAQDLGLTVDLGRRPYDKPRATRDLDLVEEANVAHAWVISPRLEREGGEYVLRIVAVPPGGRALRVRVERVKGPALSVRAAVMLRDLVGASPTSGANAAEPGRAPTPELPGDIATRARSGGRAVLAVSGAAFGGFTGFALQRASRNDDPRLLYPLVALGTGVGLGAALIAADEWDVRPGEAWYLAGGTWWPVASALFLTAGYGLEPETDRYAVALLSGLGGTGLASLVLSQRRVGEGDALLLHSGGFLGTLIGGGTQWLAEGSTTVRPYRGLGYGAAAGVLAAGALATQVRVSPARLLLVDLGAGLGALAGAAAGSPLLFDEPSKSEERAWVSLTLGGTLVGGAAAVWLTRSMSDRASFAPPQWLPMPSTITALDAGPRAQRTPGLGLAWRGTW